MELVCNLLFLYLFFTQHIILFIPILIEGFMQIKETVTDGVNEGLIETDKCGINVVFWSFPSQAAKVVCTPYLLLLFFYLCLMHLLYSFLLQRAQKLKTLRERITTTEERIKTLQEIKKDLRKGREESV